jgi:hypothetical protein
MARPSTWTEAQIEYLRQHSGVLCCRAIADKLDKAYSCVSKKARDMKLPALPFSGPPDMVRDAWVERFEMADWHRRADKLGDSDMAQLSHCKSDEARRLLLGISEQFDGSREYLAGEVVRGEKPVPPKPKMERKGEPVIAARYTVDQMMACMRRKPVVSESSERPSKAFTCPPERTQAAR